MKQLSPSARRLFESARGQDEPDELARNRVARALSLKIAAGTSLTAAGASAATSAAAWVSILVKPMLLLAVSGALVTGGWLTMRALRPAVSAVVSARPATSIANSSPAAPVEPPFLEPRPSVTTREAGKAPLYRRAVRRSLPAESPTRLPTVASDAGLGAETEALRQAQQALRDKKPEQALQLLDEQDSRFRDGRLPQERSAARILALCQAGRTGEAQAQAGRFERLWPRSALLGRVRSACWAP